MDMARWQRVQQPWRFWNEKRLRRNIGVYVHVPFCLARCRYCDFLTYGSERPPGLSEASYQEALLKEIAGRGAWAREHYAARGRIVDSVFFGGGTPTRLESAHLVELVRAVRKHFAVTGDAEFTVEANPDTLTPGLIEDLAQAGVNRLSIGIQATDPQQLRFLGRTHRWSTIQPALKAAAHGPIPRLSLDLMVGVPGLTAQGLNRSLKRLLRLQPEQISAYELTCEPGTPYAAWVKQFPTQVTPPEQVVAQDRHVARVLASYGLYRYEVCSYARPGAECRHNLRYWRGGDYIGLGLGAASRIGSSVLNNARNWLAYEKQVNLAGSDGDQLVQAAGPSTPPSAGNAALAPPADRFLQLRTRLGLLQHGVQVPPSWVMRGWVKLHSGRIELTSRGLDFADLMARELC
jgi:oxygen-independent coproporphyrinogen-3 oxidase